MTASSDGGAEPRVLKAAFEPAGSPRWIMYALKKLGLDAKHDFVLEITLVRDQVRRSLQSIEVAIQEGVVDLIDIDWISIARHRANGLPLTAVFPYGRIVGGLVAPCDSPIRDLRDLRGKRIGVVRLLDKNWIILRAACLKRYGIDLQQEATTVEALSKVTLAELLKAGQVDVALQFWQLIPPLVATGRYRQVVDVLDLIRDLGVTRPIPITLFTVSDEVLQRRSELLRGFIRAFCEAADYLKENDQIWVEVGEKVMGGVDPKVLKILRDSWRERVMTSWDGDTIRDIGLLFDELLKVGGKALLGIDRFPPGTFSPGFTR